VNFLLNYLDYVIKTIFASQEYLQHIREDGAEIGEGAMIVLVSTICIGLFSGLRSGIAVSFGEFSTVAGTSEMLSIGLRIL
jgi:hypothetical protein